MTEHAKDPELLIRQAEPLNAGPPLALLRERFVTPTARFFVRNHGPVPSIDQAQFTLQIDGSVREPLTLSLDTLRARYARRTVAATLQCAGNRRQDLMAVEPIPGELAWGAEAISNAEWSGVSLADVLESAGLTGAALHVALEGADAVQRQGRTFGFGGSIPIEKALHPDTLLVDMMNGAPLPAVHGGPLRLLVPGYIGARSVKWLQRITVQATPSDNYFQAHAYRLFPTNVRAGSVDWSQGLMLGELALNTVICTPGAGDALAAGSVEVCGYATAGGGRTIAWVDVSADNGASWQRAELEPAGSLWTWRFWRAQIALAPGQHTLVARSVDSAATSQPADARAIWNFKGYMSNAWHRVPVSVQ